MTPATCPVNAEQLRLLLTMLDQLVAHGFGQVTITVVNHHVDQVSLTTSVKATDSKQVERATNGE